MKTLLTLGLALFVVGAFAQDKEANLIAGAMGKGDAKTIGTYLVGSVDLTILDDENMYPKDQVTQKLQAFFKSNVPKGFEVKHKGKSKLDDHYRIGDLQTSNGTFRVTYFMKAENGKIKVKQLRIESY